MSAMMCEYCDTVYNTDICDEYHNAECEDCGETEDIIDVDGVLWKCLVCKSGNILIPECCS
jgi:hypothetical protein